MALADLDGDTDIDAVVGSYLDARVAWRENTDGLGAFGPAQAIATAPAGLVRVLAEDLDGDGDVDVASASHLADSLEWYPNNDGLGSFGPARGVDSALGGAWTVQASDLNGDGNLDLVSAATGGATVAWNPNISPDNCPLTSNTGQEDTDGNGLGDACNDAEDRDGDEWADDLDAFPDDPNEWLDADGDGVPDNADAFPNDPLETTDSDGDGVGDNSDVFPSNPDEWMDSDGDGVGDNGDAFPLDASETTDSDGDGVGDNTDVFPGDPAEWIDSDGDERGDNGDAFPADPAEWDDSDGDGLGDNADVFPFDNSETVDSDGDGVGDNGDAYPADPLEWADSDGDGLGDNADVFPFDANETTDSDSDGVGDNGDVYPTDPLEWADSDGDGLGDNADALPFDASETVDTDNDYVGDNSDNCLLVPNGPGGGFCSTQQDDDQDGYGNACDADFNNNGGVGLADINAALEGLTSQFLTYDMNCNGGIGLADVADALKLLGTVPGPSALACAGTIPCTAEIAKAAPLAGSASKTSSPISASEPLQIKRAPEAVLPASLMRQAASSTPAPRAHSGDADPGTRNHCLERRDRSRWPLDIQHNPRVCRAGAGPTKRGRGWTLWVID